MSADEPLNPWKYATYEPGQIVVCRVTHPEPGGYAVIISKNKHTGFLSTQSNLKINEEILAEFVSVQNDRVLLSPHERRDRIVIDRTKCRELDNKVLGVKTLAEAQLLACEILKEIEVLPDSSDDLTKIGKRAILTALVLNTGRFCVRSESPLRRARDMLNVDVEFLGKLLSHEPDENQMFSDFLKVEDPLALMDKLSEELSVIVNWPPRGTRLGTKSDLKSTEGKL
jgi:hypothetical protein